MLDDLIAGFSDFIQNRRLPVSTAATTTFVKRTPVPFPDLISHLLGNYRSFMFESTRNDGADKGFHNKHCPVKHEPAPKN